MSSRSDNAGGNAAESPSPPVEFPLLPIPAAVPLGLAPAADAPIPKPSHEAVAARARELWIARGRPQGRDAEIWLAAEASVTARRG